MPHQRDGSGDGSHAGAGRLDESIHDLQRRLPDMSAAGTVSIGQRRLFTGLVALVVIGLLAQPSNTLVVLAALAVLLYVGSFLYRVRLIHWAIKSPALVRVSDDQALALSDRELPMYTILVPAYREPEVIGRLLDHIDALDYPRDKLDVKVLLEADDEATIDAVCAHDIGPHVDVVLVPFAEPRTKPKALNYGLAAARGELVTIYDAEDRPEPLQLRRAAVAFAAADPSVACFQAQLLFYNAEQNLLTKWFTGEYSLWFSLLLPGLVNMRAPVPLGGTSNHMRRDVLEEVGGWDPFNVTEDADLGIRLARFGRTVAILDSITYEEANSDAVNWVKQRSRWYKGYLQTWLVHMRHPARLRRELGTRGFIGFNLFVGGTPLLALINPVFWTLTLLWFVIHPAFVAALFPAWLYYVSIFVWILGNFVFCFTSVLSAYRVEGTRLTLSAVLAPLYWILMSMAAVKAAVQLVTDPSFWEKTVHGLDTRTDLESVRRDAA